MDLFSAIASRTKENFHFNDSEMSLIPNSLLDWRRVETGKLCLIMKRALHTCLQVTFRKGLKYFEWLDAFSAIPPI